MNLTFENEYINKCIKDIINILGDDAIDFMYKDDGYEEMFSLACIYSNITLAECVLKVKPDINISVNNEEAFRWACRYGRLEVAQYLLKVKPNINISADNNFAFKGCCDYNNLKVAQWLQTLKPFKYYIKIENNKIISWKIYTNFKESLLFMLYTLKYKNYINSLTPNLILCISKY